MATVSFSTAPSLGATNDAARFTPIEFALTGANPSDILIYAKVGVFPSGDPRWQIVYDPVRQEFSPRFREFSMVDDITEPTSNWSVRPHGGWWWSPVEFVVGEWTPAAPVTFSPLADSLVTPATTIELDTPVAKAIIYGRVGVDPFTWDLIYDQAAFSPYFAADSDASGTVYSILPTSGWWREDGATRRDIELHIGAFAGATEI